MKKGIAIILFLCFYGGFSQVRVGYTIITAELTEKQKSNEVGQLVKDLSSQLTFFLDVKDSKSHFYDAGEEMSSDANAAGHYRQLAIITYVHGEEFWSDTELKKQITRLGSDNIAAELVVPDWKLTTETKKIDKYNCFKAEYVKRYKNAKGNEVSRTITAWFAPELPYAFGPSEYFGLPGLILELNDGNTTTFRATGISTSAAIKDIKLPENTVSKEKSEKEAGKNMDEIRRRK